MSPQGRWMRRVRCMPCAAPCLRASTLAQIGPPHPSDSIMGGPRSADPEEKREPCERHPKTPIDGRNSEVLDIERPNRRHAVGLRELNQVQQPPPSAPDLTPQRGYAWCRNSLLASARSPAPCRSA